MALNSCEMALKDIPASWQLILIIATLIVILVVLATTSGNIANNKGYSYNLFAFIGLVLPVIGLVIAAILPDKSSSNAETLLSYKKLLDEGVITQEEFDAKKRELLG